MAQFHPRWRAFAAAARAVRPKWRPHKMYEPPIFDRLQSSYEDVRFELDTMRNKLSGYRFLFAAGDGLSLMRMNHLLKMEPDKYFDQSPAIIPVQGELHGFFHLMHCHWRLNRPFIMQCADVLGNKQVKSDPSVSDLNVSRFECQKRPWKEIEAVMGRRGVDAPHAYILNYVLEMTPYFDWQP